VLFVDEARYGRISDTRRCWAPPGVRPIVPAQVIREYVYAYVAVCPFTGHVDALILPCVDADAMSIFLEEIAVEHAEDRVVVIMDQAGWHRANSLKIPENITITWLPPYSPELNPVEHIWEEIREKWFPNRVFNSLEEVVHQLEKALKWLMDSPDYVRSMTCFAWMLN
jgi:putative transposase